ncbi:bifunctional diaminohydroxyphosphoribosylaminopyrimidine deaminase/5-amino-6-(5-phosphoribosylamino)uracil reductase RibD [Polynucleobacter sp. IMCC30063]|uniref:bifunctional diaminohydroxyphosphoribosylaminopyrimidine deaminase/5-amino-6-(5-phosphoribosylamino)uracil reductase RibD n=1 Tax=unclassified Polynucleobacter TaxID=2640945 RepID=UPI001F0039FB|nr:MULTISPECIES: bifunctional diaminohydroxyphosphoribosylaminopyrimidine deaminase/5-amino-6-(5-phosphoribosylamino)uracil reductase RibD [unclassified Polynucleobacter]MCE7505195.1 bifunctional diaminohydroxyphosphoribosylaminopyrimidine deaminase/5-amino-6-(5-phosphoribosylamino)uracil reductase RibD [Polynucleobacter sp. IMCC30063]MCE7526012.1 bifunctional diaminohydroxyphosphoribosylaminopyrimidine deaminase/5-amino-6-(5-phosphoribosylamino)uracil reductase RibD [Polynucleobacter sp. IMCC 30
MLFTAEDTQFMHLAIEQAQQALYLSNPNPRVGCVIVKEGQCIGVGHTQAVGGPHAEIEALKDARTQGHNPQGATVYVTLEPCSHTGRTAPCVEALIAAKVAKVSIAMSDPNPLVSGQGIQQLRAAGIVVQMGLLEAEARALNPGFIRRMCQGLPWVRMKMAASLDGKTALPSGESQWITGPLARADGHHWRAQACAILTGVGTVIEDDPRLNVRDVNTTRQPIKIIIDSHLAIPLNAQIFTTEASGVMIVYAAANSHEQQQKAAELTARGVELIAIPNTGGKVDLTKLFSILATKYAMNEIHVEAGFKLNGSLLREDCVNELLLYLAPRFLGEGLGMAQVDPPTHLSQDLMGNDWRIIDQTLFYPDLRLRLMKMN